jgi:dihydrofolate reductase
VASLLTVDLFVSVDGWAGSDGLPGYFGYPGPELQEWITAEGAAPQLVILGRRTYEMRGGLPEQYRDEGWDRLAQLQKVVFSRTLEQATWANTRICSADLAEEIRSLKEGSDVPLRTMGSLSLARQLLGSGLVDRLRLMVFPLVAGPAGREAAFDGMAGSDLELVASRVLDRRILFVEYRPTGGDIPRT